MMKLLESVCSELQMMKLLESVGSVWNIDLMMDHAINSTLSYMSEALGRCNRRVV